MSVGIVAAFLFAAPALANIAPPPAGSPERAGETVYAFFENFNAGNAEGIASTYSDGGDFVWVENGSVAYADKAAAVAGMTERLKATPGARLETIDGYRIIAVGSGGAEVVAPFTLNVKDEKSGEERSC
ncbi:MAG: hypothetical protein QM698_16205 [Micropepsaceae bacterium]